MLDPAARSRATARRWLVVPGLVAALTGCRAAEPPPPDRAVLEAMAPPPLILLISLDTFRADLVGGVDGAGRPVTPHLEALAADSVQFTRSFAPISQTLLSHMSLLTGLYPAAHGVESEGRSLPGGIQTMAESLEAAGYRSVAVVTSAWLKPAFGFSQGFTHYEELAHEVSFADRVNATALSYVDRRARVSDPMFLFLHYYDAHSDSLEDGNTNLPYYSPPAYREGLDVTVDGGEFCDPEGRCSTGYLVGADLDRRILPPRELENIRELYRAGARYLDMELGRLFDGLKERGIYDDALIVVTSDHGEEFREHGRFIHSQTYDETLAVPLIVKFPGSWGAGHRVDRLAETVDVLPTVLELAGAPVPADVQGGSLLRLVFGEETPKTWAIGQDNMIRTLFSLRTERYKLLANAERPRRELYDLREDPGETVNLAEERPDLLATMEGKLFSLHRENLEKRLELWEEVDRSRLRDSMTDLYDHNKLEGELLSEEEKKLLRSLGYVD